MKSYLVRWKAKGMLFWRWNLVVGDEVIRRQMVVLNEALTNNQENVSQKNSVLQLVNSVNEYMVLHKRSGARVEVPYSDTCFIFSRNRSKILQREQSKI